MTNEFLPQGEAAALLPQVSFTIPGLFLFSQLVYQCLEQVAAKFSHHIPVRFLYGPPRSVGTAGGWCSSTTMRAWRRWSGS